VRVCARACVCVCVCTRGVRAPRGPRRIAGGRLTRSVRPVVCRRVGACVCVCVRVREVACTQAETKSDRFFLHLAPNSAHGVLRGARAVHRHQVTPRESRNSRRNWERAVAWTDRLDTHTDRHTDTRASYNSLSTECNPPWTASKLFQEKERGLHKHNKHLRLSGAALWCQ
jgi:hypothetical protein